VIIMDDASGSWIPSLAESDYEGWVAWVDSVPIFEFTRRVYGQFQVAPGLRQPSYNQPGRTCMEWKDLPKDRVQRVELFFCRERRPNGQHYKQPVAIMPRPLGRADIRFLQMKMGAVVVGMSGSRGQERTGVNGYRLGYWDPKAGTCQLHEWTRVKHTYLGERGHPCWPKPLGFGLNPGTVGLTAAEVPDPPLALV